MSAPPLSLEEQEKQFVAALDGELAKIKLFYRRKEAEVSAKFEELSVQVQHAESIQPEQQAAGEGRVHMHVFKAWFAGRVCPARASGRRCG
jgi:SPX domain protein involved in polyphosphate accumulation